jgi:hypothetical protein
MNRVLIALAAAALMGSGCAYIGGPLPPLANVPGPIANLAAIQRDARIIVQFTPPALTTEGMAIKKPLTFDLRIGPAAAPFNIAEWAEQARQEPSVAAVNGNVRYEIPSAAWTGKEVTIAVRAIGANGKESGWSIPLVLPVVAPPQVPTGLHAEATAAGVRLTWGGPGSRFRIFRREPGSEKFDPVTTVTGHDWVDPLSEFGKTYIYEVQALVDIGEGKEAESELTAPVTITPVDTFPPAVPAGLRAAVAPNSIELAWDRNTESDLAGYRIYRAEGSGAFAKIAEGSQIPNYSDRTIERGKTYRYTVIAVDQAGNESARAEPVEVSVP